MSYFRWDKNFEDWSRNILKTRVKKIFNEKREFVSKCDEEFDHLDPQIPQNKRQNHWVEEEKELKDTIGDFWNWDENTNFYKINRNFEKV